MNKSFGGSKVVVKVASFCSDEGWRSAEGNDRDGSNGEAGLTVLRERERGG